MLDVSPIWGLAQDSKVTEVIVRHDGIATHYEAVKRIIDLVALKAERAVLVTELATEKLSDTELLAWAQRNHPDHAPDRREAMERRIDEIDSILGI